MSRAARSKSKLGEDDDEDESVPLRFEHLRIKSRRTEGSSDASTGEQSAASVEERDTELARLRSVASASRQRIEALEEAYQRARDESLQKDKTAAKLRRIVETTQRRSNAKDTRIFQLENALELARVQTRDDQLYGTYATEKITRLQLENEQLLSALTKAYTYLTPAQTEAVERAKRRDDENYRRERSDFIENEEFEHWETQLANIQDPFVGLDEGMDDDFNEDEWRDEEED